MNDIEAIRARRGHRRLPVARAARACLASLAEHPPARPLRVVVVDNDSRDGTVELVTSHSEVELIETGRNLGFAAATNLALRRGRGALLPGPEPGHTRSAAARSTAGRADGRRRRIGIAGCRLEREDGTFDHAARRSFPTPIGALGHFTGSAAAPDAPAALAQYRAPDVERGPVDAVNGAFMLMRGRMLDEIGPFDEGYWLYMEDLDLCFRAAQAGWVTWYEPSVIVTHVKGGSQRRRRGRCAPTTPSTGVWPGSTAGTTPRPGRRSSARRLRRDRRQVHGLVEPGAR